MRSGKKKVRYIFDDDGDDDKNDIAVNNVADVPAESAEEQKLSIQPQ